MIDSKELRRGNLIMDKNGKTVLVDSIDDTCVNVGFEYVYYNDASGIPLTPEILEQCGFEKGDKGYWSNGFLVLDDKFNLPLESAFGENRNIEIKSVHQLQNLYFALTGEELDVKL